MRPKSIARTLSSLASSSSSELISEPPTNHLHFLESCISTNNSILGSQIHTRIIISGQQFDSVLSTKLITLYSQCQHFSSAKTIFNGYPTPNIFLLNAMIRGFSSNGFHEEAVDFFLSQRKVGIFPDSYTFSCLLKATAASSDIRRGRNLHQLALQSGFGLDTFVSNSLITMYAKCGRLGDSVRVFEGMPQRDIVSWNSIVSAFALNGFVLDAVEKVREMVQNSFRPDQATVVSVLTMFGIEDRIVRELHCYVLRRGHESDTKIHNALISAYGKCGLTKEVREVFDGSTRKDRVTWNALISCYAQNGLFEESMQLLSDMKLSGFEPDVVTYSGIISSLSQNDLSDEAMSVFEELLVAGLKPDVVAIASILPSVYGVLSLDFCKEIHAYSYRQGMESDRRVRNALVSVYSKCGLIGDAEIVFEAIGNKDVISWSSMVVGFTQNHYFIRALEMFRKMVRAGIELNPVTVTSMLSAFAGLSALNLGKELHLWATKRSYDGQSFVGSALIDMYAKSGRIEDARMVFDLMEERNSVTWNSMIGAYAVHGLGEDALELLHMMKEPDDISFIAALSACSHGGLVEEGIHVFNSMEDLGIGRREAHYACVVDLLGRAGRIEEALDLVRAMPFKASSEIWGVLLGACKMHLNLEVAMFSGTQIIKLGSSNSGYYVLLSNILADFGRWREVEVMRDVMKENGVKKGAGCSWIEIDKGVHCFVAKERAQHPGWENLFRWLNFLSEHMKE